MNVLSAHFEDQMFGSPNEITILDDLEEFIRQHLDARYASAQLFNPALKNLHLVAYRGFAKALMDQFDDVPITSGTTCARAARHRVPILVPDVTTDAEWNSLPEFLRRSRNWRSSIASAIIQNGRTIRRNVLSFCRLSEAE